MLKYTSGHTYQANSSLLRKVQDGYWHVEVKNDEGRGSCDLVEVEDRGDGASAGLQRNHNRAAVLNHSHRRVTGPQIDADHSAWRSWRHTCQSSPPRSGAR